MICLHLTELWWKLGENRQESEQCLARASSPCTAWHVAWNLLAGPTPAVRNIPAHPSWWVSVTVFLG